jgi:hypothetical protein
MFHEGFHMGGLHTLTFFNFFFVCLTILLVDGVYYIGGVMSRTEMVLRSPEWAKDYTFQILGFSPKENETILVCTTEDIAPEKRRPIIKKFSEFFPGHQIILLANGARLEIEP